MATSARLEELKQKFHENPRRYFAPLANEHRKLGDLDQAIALCRAHLPQQPQHVSGHIVLAQALYEAGNIPDSRGTFELALDLDPENLIALRFLGDIARTQGERSAARQWYERVLDADPRNDEIAQLIRDLERDTPAQRVTEPPAPRQEPAAATPNEAATGAVTESWTESAPASDPIEDLATAWQHETAALDSGSFEAPSAPSVSEPVAEREAPAEEEPVYSITEYTAKSYTPESGVGSIPVAEPELDLPDLAVSEQELELPKPETPAASFEPAVAAPNESWAEPDEEFVASVPEVASEVPPAPPPFQEIDYSMFEAVADEEDVAQAETETAPPALAPVEEPQAAPAADDWFAQPHSREAEPAVAEATSETAFDLDAAFQSVLPNKSQETEEQPVTVGESSHAAPVSSTWAAADEEAREEAPVGATQAGGDSVDDAFATLDALTANLDSEDAEPQIDERDQRYIAPEFVGASHHVDALVAKTPESGVPSVEETPSAFVTETMAELYLQQGFREEALGVYRQLLAMNPDDSVLAARVRALEGGEAPSDTGDLESFRLAPVARADAVGQSMRAFLSVFARRRAPMRRRQPAYESTPVPAAEPQTPAVADGGLLSALFGAPQGNDEGSAAVLAGAFAEPNAESLPGRPTRAASDELSLGDVFSGNVSGNRAATFDEFFSTGSGEQPAKSPLDEEGSDMVQFTAWLEGLKKK